MKIRFSLVVFLLSLGLAPKAFSEPTSRRSLRVWTEREMDRQYTNITHYFDRLINPRVQKYDLYEELFSRRLAIFRLDLQEDIRPSLRWIDEKLKPFSSANDPEFYLKLFQANIQIIGHDVESFHLIREFILDQLGSETTFGAHARIAADILIREPRLLTYGIDLIREKAEWFEELGVNVGTLLINNPALFCYGLLSNLKKTYRVITRDFGIKGPDFLYEQGWLLTRNTQRVQDLAAQAQRLGINLRVLDPVLKRRLIQKVEPQAMRFEIQHWEKWKCEKSASGAW